MKSSHLFKLFLLIILCLATSLTFAQQNSASISESQRSLKTYPFSNPNPIPILTNNPSIYPYFKYEGYSQEGKPQDWKVVKLENDLVEVYVLPEVGGKVWGAIEKSTGEEFIYRNEVMKFRNISMRGPWTSGGIEFNFGIIGHHPSTATPVDYVWQEHEDGSVSCTVGNIDLTSRTQWRVKIILPKDKAYFETEALWYNPSPMNQSYYNWMTAAAPARDDFEFFTPGDQYLKHSGEAKSWPFDQMGRDLSQYNENRFGPAKSYHVVGEYNDFFGGYYHDGKYGFGHWGEYEEIPGQKLWLWALSRAGGIWEDLLTDTDGQYIEFQAGRLFVQYAPGNHKNPITQASFEPYAVDSWREVWFPVKELGGITDASTKAAMNIESTETGISIHLHAFQVSDATLEVKAKGEVLHREEMALQAMQVFSRNIDLKGNKDYKVEVKELNLAYDADPEIRLIDRPFETHDFPASHLSAEKMYRAGMEEMKYRRFGSAKNKFEAVLEQEPSHIAARVAIGELYYRSGEYTTALDHVQKALSLDTYEPNANYVAGIIYRAMGDKINAKESLGWAARSMQYRSNAYAQMAEIMLSEGQFKKASSYAQKALDFNRFNIPALQVKAISARKMNDEQDAAQSLMQILDIDPLNHFAKFEAYLLSEEGEEKARAIASHRSELAYQTFLELAIDYYNKGLSEEVIQVLELAPQQPMVDLWWTFLQQDPDSKYLQGVTDLDPALVFPFRRESLEVLEWANQYIDHWKLKYYLALNLWGKGRLAEAADIMKKIGNQADYAPFYAARAALMQQTGHRVSLKDLQQAFKLDQADWRNWRALTNYYAAQDQTEEALRRAKEAHLAFPGNYATGMDYAKALIQAKKYEESIAILNQLQVLPFEGASEGRRLYEQAHHWASLDLIKQGQYQAAIALLNQSKEWPESLGVGKPYDPDERIADYLLAYCYQKLGKKKSMAQYQSQVATYSQANVHQATLSHALGYKSIQQIDGQQKANAFIEGLLNSKDTDSPMINWIASYAAGNLRQQAGEEAQYKSLKESDAFKFMQEVLRLE